MARAVPDRLHESKRAHGRCNFAFDCARKKKTVLSAPGLIRSVRFPPARSFILSFFLPLQLLGGAATMYLSGGAALPFFFFLLPLCRRYVGCAVVWALFSEGELACRVVLGTSRHVCIDLIIYSVDVACRAVPCAASSAGRLPPPPLPDSLSLFFFLSSAFVQEFFLFPPVSPPLLKNFVSRSLSRSLSPRVLSCIPPGVEMTRTG